MMAKHGKARKSKQRAEKILKLIIEISKRKEVAIAIYLVLDGLDGQIDGATLGATL